MRVRAVVTPSHVRVSCLPDVSRRPADPGEGDGRSRGDLALVAPLDNGIENGTPRRARFEGGSSPDSGWGRTVFTRLGKWRIRDAAAVMEEQYENSECLFLTGTLPSVSRESLAAIARYSPYVVDRLNSWVYRQVGRSPDFFWVWEFQKRGALHLHYVVACHDGESLRRILEGFKSEWIRLLRGVEERSGVDMFRGRRGDNKRNGYKYVQAYASRIEKSVGRYMSKYLSKGFDNANNNTGTNSFFYPSRWWRVSASLMSKIKAGTIEAGLEFLKRRAAESMVESLEAVATASSGVLLSFRNRFTTGNGFCYFPRESSLKESFKCLITEIMNTDWRSKSVRLEKVRLSFGGTECFLTQQQLTLMRSSLRRYALIHSPSSKEDSLSLSERCGRSFDDLDWSMSDVALLLMAIEATIEDWKQLRVFSPFCSLSVLYGELRSRYMSVVFPDGVPPRQSPTPLEVLLPERVDGGVSACYRGTTAGGEGGDDLLCSSDQEYPKQMDLGSLNGWNL